MDPDSFITGTFVLLEFFQKTVFHSVDSAFECAWPHTKNQHLLQLGVGRLDEGDYPTKLDLHAVNALKDAGRLIVGEEFTEADYFTNFLQPWNDYKAVSLLVLVGGELDY